MSVGVLGAVGLLTMSMQGNRSAALGTEAASLVEDMMDRIRVNAAAALYGGLALGDPPPVSPDCGAVACTNEQMAMYDQAVWKCRLGRYADAPVCIGLGEVAGVDVPGTGIRASGLPQGDGSIEFDPAAGLVRVSVQWLDRGQVRSVSVQSRI